MTDKPDTPHQQYAAMKATWKMCRDCVEGQRAIHKAGEEYLPKLSGQSPEAYNAYKKRALYMNATGRTKEGMTGLVFRRYPTIKLPEALKAFEVDINMEGLSLAGMAQAMVEELLEVGRYGLFVDHPTTAPLPNGAARTIEQSRREGLRPYITAYKAESIINWRYGRVNNVTKLVNVFLLEVVEGEDEAQIRELHLDNGSYGQRIWRKAGKTTGQWLVVQEIFPLMGGKPITEIPFWFCQPKEGRGDVQTPPLEDLCHVNLAHYMNSADLENGAHIAGLPTPWVNGVGDPVDFPELHLGSGTVLTLPPNAQAGFLQCGNEGFATIEKAMDRKENQMAALGARMLASEKKAQETEGALEAKRGGENSVLATLAASGEMSFTNALRFMALWVGANADEASIELNKRYLPTPMDSAMLGEWIKAWQTGAISYETFFGGLQRGELVPETTTAEEELDKIGSQEPVLGTIGTGEDTIGGE